MSKVFSIYGSEPEVLAYAMAKYSRSSKPMEDTLREINADKAASFLNTFYFQYGHRSIADLAHVPMVLEGISMLAAIDVVDETRWDGQERSTRYQDFSKREVYTPEGLSKEEAILYRSTIELLFDAYDKVTELVAAQLRLDHPLPEGMDEAAWNRTIMARTFDMSRYLLPLATLTSVGQITSARTLEGQVSRLLSSPYPEIVSLGEKMKEAVQAPAFNIHEGAEPVASAPTLVKYAEPDEYRIASHEVFRGIAKEVMAGTMYKPAFRVTLIEFDSPEEEIVCCLIYEASRYPMKQVRKAVRGLDPVVFNRILETAKEHRGRHDELPRAFHTGGFIFDIYMDIGGFRDMHRHRRCTQIFQNLTFDHLDSPGFPSNPELSQIYRRVMKAAQVNYADLRALGAGNSIRNADYILPLGVKRRFLMKMDFAELAYISELRTGPAGHISYRRVAYDMFKLVEKRHPLLTQGLRVTNVDEPVDFFKR